VPKKKNSRMIYTGGFGMLFEFLRVRTRKPIAMKRLPYILPILAIIIAGCHREPYADGIVAPNPAFVGEDVSFTDLSTNSDYIEWEFGDGVGSSDYFAVHRYIDPGFYDASLRAFGTKGGVNTWSFALEVIGSELTVVVQLWTPPEEDPGYFVQGASVILYPTLDDWINETNPVDEQFTNQYGEATFDGLSYQRYYVDVWEANHDNYTLAAEDVGWIETPMLLGTSLWEFYAYVDY
jgi:PKD repeat protein